MSWLFAIAAICSFVAAFFVLLEVLSWTDNWAERRDARKRNQAHRVKRWYIEDYQFMRPDGKVAYTKNWKRNI